MDAKIPSYSGSDRILGCILLSILLFICVGLGAYGVYTLMHPTPIRILLFPQIGNLKPDDQVYLKGVKIGLVRNMKWLPQHVVVYVTENRPFVLHEGYHIDDIDIGTMGDRILMIIDDNSAAPIIGNRDTLYGTFHPGVSEAIGLIHKFCVDVDSLTALSQRLRFGTPKQTSLITKTRLIANTADSLSLSLSDALTGVSAALVPALDSLTRLLSSTAGTTHRTAAALPAILTAADTDMYNINNSMQHISALITKVQSVTSSLEKHPLLAASSSDSLRIQQELTQVKDVLQHLQNGLLQIKFRLRLW